MRIARVLLRAAPAVVISVCLVAADAPALAHAPGQKDDKDAPATTLRPDKGTFRILLSGQVVGREEFEISVSNNVWTARGSTTMHVPGAGEINATGRLQFAPDGAPIRYDWATQTQKKASGAIEFSGGKAKTSVDVGGTSPFSQDFAFSSPRIAVLDNNLYDQYALLARLYDWKTGGKQVFPVLIPQDMTPGSISVESLGSQQVGNAKYETLRVSSPDLEILLYLDNTFRLMRLEVPASKVTIERQ